jgi:hypothetical protein
VTRGSNSSQKAAATRVLLCLGELTRQHIRSHKSIIYALQKHQKGFLGIRENDEMGCVLISRARNL